MLSIGKAGTRRVSRASRSGRKGRRPRRAGGRRGPAGFFELFASASKKRRHIAFLSFEKVGTAFANAGTPRRTRRTDRRRARLGPSVANRTRATVLMTGKRLCQENDFRTRHKSYKAGRPS